MCIRINILSVFLSFILNFGLIFFSSNVNANNRLERLTETLTKSNYDDSDLIGFSSLVVGLKSENEWHFWECEKDHFNNDKKCSMSKKNLIVLILNGKTFIQIGANHFPHESSAIKIDNNRTIYGKEGIFRNNNQILNEMLSGKKAAIRFVEWPKSYNIDDEIDLIGFSEAYQKLKMDYRNIR